MTLDILENLAALKAGLPSPDAGKMRSRVLVGNAPAGVFVAMHANELCKVPDTAALITGGKGGVLRYEAAKRTETNTLEYAAGEQVTFFGKGPMSVITEEAVTAGDPAYVRFATGTGTQLGAFRNDPDGDAENALRLTNALTTDSIEIDVCIDGVLFSVATGSSETAAAKAILIAAAIDAHADFVAAQVGSTAEINITRADGARPQLTFAQTGVTETSGDTCARLPNAYFVDTRASGVALVMFDLP